MYNFASLLIIIISFNINVFILRIISVLKITSSEVLLEENLSSLMFCYKSLD